MANTRKFKNQMIDAYLNIAKFTPVQKDSIIAKLKQNVSAAISIAILKKLSKEEAQELKEISALKNETKLLNYIKEKIKTMPLLVSRVTRKTIDDFNNARVNSSQVKDESLVKAMNVADVKKESVDDELQRLNAKIKDVFDGKK